MTDYYCAIHDRFFRQEDTDRYCGCCYGNNDIGYICHCVAGRLK